jgi:hypothetical protein
MVLSQAKADTAWPCHHCGAELGPELNQRIGELPLSVALKTPHFPQVNDVLPTGHTVLAVYKNLFVLAQSNHPESPTPFVVWNLDQDGDTYGGGYFNDEEKAQREFVERCFPRLNLAATITSPVKCEPVAGVVIDMKRMAKDLERIYAERQQF